MERPILNLRLRRYLPGVAVIALLCVTTLAAQDEQRQQDRQSDHSRQTNAQILEELETMRARIGELEAQLREKSDSAPPASNQQPAGDSQPTPDPANAADRSALDFLRGTTINLGLDGYYTYNFNHPLGRVNLLHAYDVSSNSFSLSQATLIFEHAPDVSAGRPFGARVDLQFGQATETLAGNPANELRPQVYRNLFQAYGTYVAPVGTGLNVDFGKWASALGPEGNYNKDQFNYSRSYFFFFLPFYHVGFRTAYAVNPKLSFGYWLVNGAQQAEDFNGLKSQNFQILLKPTNEVSWTTNYYFGQEGRDVVAVPNPGIPTRPTQPGLPETNVSPAPNGRLHIFDSYAFWNASKNLTLGGEFDYVINRQFAHSAPAHVTGGAGYAHYQLTSKAAVAARGEYLSDRGGLFSGATQALKETTVTYEYKIADGLISRLEWRRDFSNQPFFLTDVPGSLQKDQNTATLGLIWWWGRKEGSW